MESGQQRRKPKGRKPQNTEVATADPPALGKKPDEFTIKKAIFEIAIVAVGVLLALIVDHARQSLADRSLANQARSAMKREIEENRIRLATKLTLLHNAYRALQTDPAVGPDLVSRRSNFQIAMTDAAWIMAAETGALRLLADDERQRLAYVYTSQGIYNQLLAQEMNHWTAMAAAGPDDRAVKLWMAYAERLGVSVCIASIRIEKIRHSQAASPRPQQICQAYRISTPPSALFHQLGITPPNTAWRPGDDF